MNEFSCENVENGNSKCVFVKMKMSHGDLFICHSRAQQRGKKIKRIFMRFLFCCSPVLLFYLNILNHVLML